MKNTKPTLVRVALLLLVLGAITFNVFLNAVKRSQEPHALHKERSAERPKEGEMLNASDGRIPGDGARGVADLNRIYTYIQRYRARRGKYPKNTTHAIVAGQPNIKVAKQVMKTFVNPDAKYSDWNSRHPSWNAAVPYMDYEARPDGSPLYGPKKAGTRDALASTDIYVRMNNRVYLSGKKKSQIYPQGFYLVLWEDGEVEKIPTDKVFYGSTDGHGWRVYFPNQAGAPKHIKTFDEFWKNTVRVKPGP